MNGNQTGRKLKKNQPNLEAINNDLESSHLHLGFMSRVSRVNKRREISSVEQRSQELMYESSVFRRGLETPPTHTPAPSTCHQISLQQPQGNEGRLPTAPGMPCVRILLSGELRAVFRSRRRLEVTGGQRREQSKVSGKPGGHAGRAVGVSPAAGEPGRPPPVPQLRPSSAPGGLGRRRGRTRRGPWTREGRRRQEVGSPQKHVARSFEDRLMWLRYFGFVFSQDFSNLC